MPGMVYFHPTGSVADPVTFQAIIGKAEVTAHNRAYFERCVTNGQGEIRAAAKNHSQAQRQARRRQQGREIMPAVSQVPSSQRVGLVFLQPTAGRTPAAANAYAALIVGRAAAASAAEENVLTQIISTADAQAQFGAGSPLAKMAAAYYLNNPGGALWALPQLIGNGTKTTWVTTIAADAYASARLTVDDSTTDIAFAAADNDATKRAAKIVAAINGNPDLPITAAAPAAEITISHKCNGSANNAVKLTLTEGSDTTTAELVLTQGNGAVAPLAGAVGDAPFKNIILESPDAAYMGGDAFTESLLTPRWNALGGGLYGHAFYAFNNASVNTIIATAAGRNYEHESIIGINSPTNAAEIAAAVAAVANRETQGRNASRPMRTVQVLGIKTAPAGQNFTKQEQNTLLNNKVSALNADDFGNVRIERIITTYSVDAAGRRSRQWLDYNKLATSEEVLTRFAVGLEAQYSRAKIVDELPPTPEDPNMVTTGLIKAFLVGLYEEMANEGLVENVAAFADAVVVERDLNDNTRVNAILPVDTADQLRIFAALVEVN